MSLGYNTRAEPQKAPTACDLSEDDTMTGNEVASDREDSRDSWQQVVGGWGMNCNLCEFAGQVEDPL